MKIIINGEIVEVAEGGSGDTTFLVKAPIGTIVIWSGTADNIPTGWQLCDGTNGTPDLRDKFVLGAGTAHAVGESGGSETVTLTVEQMPKHRHILPSTGNTMGSIVQYSSANWGAGRNLAQPQTNTEGAGQPHPNMPPYYALCYIMKLTADPAVDGVTMDQVNTAIQTAVADIQPQEVYSTEETRIGTWIDGKPLYRKVYTDITALKGSSTSYTIRSIVDATDLDVDMVIRLYGVSKTNTQGGYIYLETPKGDWSVSDAVSVGLSYDTANKHISTYVKNQNATIGLLVFEYTKTTDEATS